MITSVKLQKFTAFKDLQVGLSPGVNVFIGANGTGKTHILKAIYAACEITKGHRTFADKILGVFMPSRRKLGRLVHRQRGSAEAALAMVRQLPEAKRKATVRLSFSNHADRPDSAKVTGINPWCREPISAVYIPVKEMLANAPGFQSMVSLREAHFEEVYADIVERALLPLLRGPVDGERRKLLRHLQRTMDGKVSVKEEEFFHNSKQGNLEFSLLAEGFRKLGLLWVLIQNGTLLNGSVLCWDEPEANLNPRLVGHMADILLGLQRAGVQIFLATHDYVLLKEFDLRSEDGDEIIFHSLYRSQESGEIEVETVDAYTAIHPNAISDTFADLYDRDLNRALVGGDS